MVKLYNRSNVIGAFSALNSISIGYENNNARTIQFTDNGNTISFQVFNLQQIIGSTTSVTYDPIDTTSTGPEYNSRVFEVFDFLSSEVFQGFSPGPTFVGGVVAAYPNFASFPVTGTQSVIYIDEADNSAYYWDGSSYQLLIAKNVEQYASFALFPVTGTANVIYIDMSVPEPYVWNGTTYESLTDSATVAWGSITGTLAAQTDLQAALDAKFDDPTGTTSEYIRGDGSLATFPAIPVGTVTSVGLKMPSAFNVANSPITSSGLLDVTGAGTIAEYIRGDGSLATFPSSTGGGASLSFYLNGSVSQGTFGGVAFREMDRTPIIGAGTDFTIATNGYIQSFITDANVPNQLEIPAGNWNFETYFSASSNGGTPSYYIELYKWDGTTLSLIASGSANPEGITNGTATHLYVSAIAVPQTTLALTDRLAVRIYVNNSGRTIKLHTENSHLCQVITTFSTGLTALNGLTAQVQNFATGTTGTDFGISSATSTHTFNLPTASATNRGALSSTDWTTFNSKVPSTRSLTINGTTQDLSADRTFTIATGLTVGTTPITSGTVGRVLFEGTGNVLQQSANFFWDNTNSRLGIGTATPAYQLSLAGSANIQGVTGLNFLVGTRGIFFGLTGSTEVSTYLATSPLIFSLNQGSTPVARFSATNGNLLINTTTDAGYKLDVNGGVRFGTNFIWDNTNSRLGVGTASPTTRLFVKGEGATASTTSFRVENSTNSVAINYTDAGLLSIGGTTTSDSGIGFRLVGTTTNVRLGIYGTDKRGIYLGNTGSNCSIYAYDYAASSARPLVLNEFGGNVLIGTTTDAGFKLDVNGTARIKGVGTTTAITFSVQNSASTNLLTITDAGSFATTTSNFSSVVTNNSNSFQVTGSIAAIRVGSSITIASSSILQADSTTQGFLPPRMTTTQKNAIASPAAGLVVYDTTLGKLCVRGAASWETITSL
jgi:hypothetical protein